MLFAECKKNVKQHIHVTLWPRSCKQLPSVQRQNWAGMCLLQHKKSPQPTIASFIARSSPVSLLAWVKRQAEGDRCCLRSAKSVKQHIHGTLLPRSCKQLPSVQRQNWAGMCLLQHKKSPQPTVSSFVARSSPVSLLAWMKRQAEGDMCFLQSAKNPQPTHTCHTVAQKFQAAAKRPEARLGWHVPAAAQEKSAAHNCILRC